MENCLLAFFSRYIKGFRSEVSGEVDRPWEDYKPSLIIRVETLNGIIPLVFIRAAVGTHHNEARRKPLGVITGDCVGCIGNKTYV